jgi:hypothetical protein
MTTISTPTPDTLDVSLFGIVPHLDVLSRLMLLQSHNGRFPIAHTKSRALVVVLHVSSQTKRRRCFSCRVVTVLLLVKVVELRLVQRAMQISKFL